MSRLLPCAAALLLAALPARPARAATAVAATVEALARGSALVVRGRVLRTEARLGADGARIYTFAELEVAEALRGAAPARLVVRVPGGVVGGRGQRVAGAATFAAGEEVVVFLRPTGAVHEVAGLAQGKFAVEGAQARPALGGLDLLPPGDAAAAAISAGERLVGPMALAELLRRIRSAR